MTAIPESSSLSTQFRPLSTDKRKWSAVCVAQDQVTVRGGYNSKGEMATALQYQTEGNIHTFVALDKNSFCFVKGVGGKAKGDLKPVEVLHMLRSLYNKASDPEDRAAVAGDDSQSISLADGDDELDPMDALDSMDSVAQAVAQVVPTATKKAPKRQRCVERACVYELVVPARPVCASNAHGATLSVFVYNPEIKRRQGVL